MQRRQFLALILAGGAALAAPTLQGKTPQADGPYSPLPLLHPAHPDC